MSFTLTCNCCGHKQELENKSDENVTKYYANLQAAEELRNESICVIEDGEIRKMRNEDIKSNTVFVYVSNPMSFTHNNTYIEKGSFVRYRFIRGEEFDDR